MSLIAYVVIKYMHSRIACKNMSATTNELVKFNWSNQRHQRSVLRRDPATGHILPAFVVVRPPSLPWSLVGGGWSC